MNNTGVTENSRLPYVRDPCLGKIKKSGSKTRPGPTVDQGPVPREGEHARVRVEPLGPRHGPEVDVWS